MKTNKGSGDGWRPDPAQLQWTRNLIASMNDGGTWGVPANGNVYIFDKKANVLRFVAGDENNVLHQRTVVIFNQLGWTVRDERGNATGLDATAFAESRQLGSHAGRGAQAARLLRGRL